MCTSFELCGTLNFVGLFILSLDFASFVCGFERRQSLLDKAVEDAFLRKRVKGVDDRVTTPPVPVFSVFRPRKSSLRNKGAASMQAHRNKTRPLCFAVHFPTFCPRFNSCHFEVLS